MTIVKEYARRTDKGETTSVGVMEIIVMEILLYVWTPSLKTSVLFTRYETIYLRGSENLMIHEETFIEMIKYFSIWFSSTQR